MKFKPRSSSSGQEAGDVQSLRDEGALSPCPGLQLPCRLLAEPHPNPGLLWPPFPMETIGVGMHGAGSFTTSWLYGSAWAGRTQCDRQETPSWRFQGWGLRNPRWEDLPTPCIKRPQSSGCSRPPSCYVGHGLRTL